MKTLAVSRLRPSPRAVRWIATAVVVLLVLPVGAVGLLHLMNSRTFQFFGGLTSRVDTASKVVALTFDDGPDPAGVHPVLDLLTKRGVRATFYLIGQELERHPELGVDIAARGHEIGNHTYSHRRMVFVTSSQVTEEIERTDALIRARQPKHRTLGDTAAPAVPQLQLTEHDRDPGRQRAQRGHVDDDFECLRGHGGVERDAEQGNDAGEQDAAIGHAVAGHPRGEYRCAAVHRHRSQDAAGAVQTGVQAGERGGEHDNAHDRACAVHAQLREKRDEGTRCRGIRAVRQQESEQQQRADVEQGDPADHRIDGSRHHFRRVLGLPRRDTDQFHPGMGEHDARCRRHQRQRPGREPPAVVRDHGQSGRLPLDVEVPDQQNRADDQEGDKNHDLHQRGPELQLAIPFHRYQVRAQHDDQRRQCEQPLRDRVECAPVVEIGSDGGRFRDTDHRQHEEVHPPGGERQFLAEKLTGI